MSHSAYYDAEAIAAGVRDGQHREIIGGLWDQMGRHQLDFLVARGLQPDSRLLDIGCGSLRLGVLAIAYLQSGRYFGTDINANLIEAGRTLELDEALRAKAPASNFAANEDFTFDFLPEAMDFAIAQSVFTHLPLNHLRRCLDRLAPHMRPGGLFFATHFLCPPDAELFAPLSHPGGDIVTYDYRDPYHYRGDDMAWAMDPAVWSLEEVGDWNHPRGQKMALYRRL